MGGDIFTLGGGSAGPGPGGGNPAAAACMAATNWANKTAPAGGDLGDLEGLPVLQVLLVLAVPVVGEGVVEVVVLALLPDLRLHLLVGLVQPSQTPNAIVD